MQQLKNYSVAGIVPSFEDLKYLYVEIDSYIYYNTNFIGDPNNLRSDVVNAITEYANGSELNQFGGVEASAFMRSLALRKRVRSELNGERN